MHQGISLPVFIDGYRPELLARWQDVVRSRRMTSSADSCHLDDYVGALLDDIASAITTVRGPSQTGVVARQQFERDGPAFDLESIIRECAVIRSLLLRGIGKYQVSLTAQQLETMNEVIDNAILCAVRARRSSTSSMEAPVRSHLTNS